MLRKFAKTFLPNPLDWKLKRNRKAKSVLLCWNRGLGDIALGVAAIVHRIRSLIPEAKITVLTRENLKDGFSLLEGLEILVSPTLKRGEVCDWKREVGDRTFDLVFEKPSPTDWCHWQHRTFTPRLKWNSSYDDLWKRFDLSDEFTYIGVQVSAETPYGLWRNYPEQRWNELFDRIEKLGNVRVLLFGFDAKMQFHHPMILDLRGKTNFFELFSIIKNRCAALVMPDSGISSITYYLDTSFPIRLVTLWGDPNHGILKQGVSSPNPQLVHVPLIAPTRDLSQVSAAQVFESLFPKVHKPPLRFCPKPKEEGACNHSANEVGHLAGPSSLNLRVGCVILAGGQGSRLGVNGPKGLFQVLNQTLFAHLMEKIPPNMMAAVMTSPQNGQETKDYFGKTFDREVLFFEQSSLSLLDEKYRPVGIGPDGNGSVYRGLVSSGILDRLEKEGVEHLFFIPVENPLADPADRQLFAHHLQEKADVTIKCIPRIKGESMGALAEDGTIVEYFDIDQDDYLYSYTGQVVLTIEFIRKAATLALPLHWVRKKAMVGGQQWIVWKREKILFEAFPIANKRASLCYEREACYAPIKTLEQKEAVEKLLRRKKK